MPNRAAVIAALLFASVPALAIDLDQARRDYLAAQTALDRGRLSQFADLRARLLDYPLRPWLDAAYFESRIATTPKSALHEFIVRNPDAVVTAQFRRKWLMHLAREGDFETFMQELPPGERDAALNCERIAGMLQKGRSDAKVLGEIAQVWQTGATLPANCDKVFDAWRASGQMTEDRVWDRIWLAIERRNIGLVDQLRDELPRRDRVWVERLLAMHRDPAKELEDFDYPVETRRAREIVRHGIARLAREDALAAMERWRNLREEYEFFGEDENYVLRAVGLQAALQHRPEALEWLAAVSADPSDEAIRQWRVRAAARAGHWPTAMKFTSMLTDTEQADDEWRYWRARAEDETGAKQAARETYGSLAKRRGFYGFLAADRVNQPYELNDTRVGATPDERATVAALPGIRMAQELFILGETPEARRQWAHATEPLDSRGLAIAATLAQEWGWHDRAIRTANRADALDDLELRFPIAYRDLVEANARAYDLDPGWIYGVMRQESMFVPDARSPAGALGLMQLMPRTGKLVAKELNMGRMPPSRMLDIENNLKLGAGYLRRMLDQNGGNAMLATASYNAGPHRVRKWLPAEGEMSADVWANSIPYTETRDYVKNVMVFTTIYEHRLGMKPTRLSARMRNVPGAGDKAGTAEDW